MKTSTEYKPTDPNQTTDNMSIREASISCAGIVCKISAAVALCVVAAATIIHYGKLLAGSIERWFTEFTIFTTSDSNVWLVACIGHVAITIFAWCICVFYKVKWSLRVLPILVLGAMFFATWLACALAVTNVAYAITNPSVFFEFAVISLWLPAFAVAVLVVCLFMAVS